MLKSNSKVFMDKVENYIIQGLSDPDNQQATDKQILSSFHSDFMRVMDTPIFSQKNVIEFLWMLPNFVHFEFTTYGQRLLLKSWFEQTDIQNDKYADEKVTKEFMYLIYRAIAKLMIKYDVF